MTIGVTRFRRWGYNIPRTASAIVRFIFEPSSGVDPMQRRRVRMLSIFLLIMTVNTIVSMLVLKNVGGDPWIVLQGTSLALFLGYLVSRTRYYQAALVVAITIPALPPLAIALFKPPEVNLSVELMWLALPLMVAALMLTARGTIIVAIGYASFTAALKVFGLMEMKDLAPVIGYLIIVTFFVIVISIIRKRDRVEIENQVIELQRVEKLLSENNEQLDTILNSIPCGIIVVDEEAHVIQDVNNYASRIIGLRPEEIIGKECHRFICPTQRGKCPITDLGSQTDNSERVLIDTSGKSIPILKNIVRVTMGGRRYLLETFVDITERKRIEAALRESEEQFSKAFHASPDSISISRLSDGVFIEVNESYTRTFGYTREELVGHNADDLNLWANPEQRESMLRKIRERVIMNNEEIQTRTKAGEIRTQLISSEYVSIGGEPCLLVVSTDISERKSMEESLANEAIRRRILIEQSRDGIVILDQDGTVFEANRRFAEMLGYSSEEILKLNVWDWEFLYPPEQVKEMLRTVGEAGDHFKTTHRRKDGTTLDVEISTNGAMFSGQKLIFCVCRDISERNRMEKALRESEEKFSKAFYNIPEAISISRLSDGTFVEVNDTYTRVTGYTRDKAIGRSSEELKLWVNADQRNEVIRRIQAGGRVENEEFQLVVKSGEKRTILLSADIININGEPCLLIIGNDISERKRAEEKLKEALANLERSSGQLAATNKELEAFSYSVSHDLRSPLRSIDGFSQALIEDYKDTLDEKGQDYLQRLRSASQKMGELIDGILKLSRLTRSEIHHEPIDLSALAREIAGRLQEAQPERRAEFVIHNDLTATGDPQLMRVLLENLLGNAWKFTGKKPTAKIEFGVENQNGRQSYFIRDNGAGFDMTYVDKLFGAFQRLHEVTEFPGTGIGLATVKRIIHRHGGTIWAEGQPGEGATFHFTIN